MILVKFLELYYILTHLMKEVAKKVISIHSIVKNFMTGH